MFLGHVSRRPSADGLCPDFRAPMNALSGSTREDIMVQLNVNGQQRSFDGDPSMPLMWFLRDELGLTGTKFGCGVALCGACTVHLNGEAVRACGVSMSDVGGKTVVTIEGLDPK